MHIDEFVFIKNPYSIFELDIDIGNDVIPINNDTYLEFKVNVNLGYKYDSRV